MRRSNQTFVAFHTTPPYMSHHGGNTSWLDDDTNLHGVEPMNVESKESAIVPRRITLTGIVTPSMTRLQEEFHSSSELCLLIGIQLVVS